MDGTPAARRHVWTRSWAKSAREDGYAAYPAFARGKQSILIGRMAHVQRGFFEAREQSPQIADWIINQIEILYGWEEQLRESRAGPALRQARRSSHSRMVMDRLGRASLTSFAEKSPVYSMIVQQAAAGTSLVKCT
jgi:hypothetical protein